MNALTIGSCRMSIRFCMNLHLKFVRGQKKNEKKIIFLVKVERTVKIRITSVKSGDSEKANHLIDEVIIKLSTSARPTKMQKK